MKIDLTRKRLVVPITIGFIFILLCFQGLKYSVSAQYGIGLDTNVRMPQPNREETAVLQTPTDPNLLSPSWFSEEADQTQEVAWGDMDGDGDLDLAVANDDGSQIYENQDGQTLILVFTLPQAAPAQSIAWGDIDGDGDLDLAIGNRNNLNQIHENENGMFDTDPYWQSPVDIGKETAVVAWGDMDSDGDLDLAVGNLNRQNQIYENVNGNFLLNVTYGWQSPMTYTSESLAWGDIDGDGDLDLAVGNDGEENQLYRNQGDGDFVVETWSVNSENTYSIAWGDADGDGDLDLAIANSGQDHQLYTNDGYTLSLSPTWYITNSTQTRSVAWGDADRDGDLDLAFGNWGDENEVYYNDGFGQFTLAWVSTADTQQTASLAWGDIDNDGHLDLAVGNNNIVNQVFENADTGNFVASTISGATLVQGMAFGDIDGDNDLDLAIARASSPFGTVNQIYLNDGNNQFTHATDFAIFTNSQNVAWGDWDGDGDVDLAVANGSDSSGQKNQVFENVDGQLMLDPDNNYGWESPDTAKSFDVAWGDWDNDGDLDLAIGNRAAANQIFENDGQTLQLDPANGWGWQSSTTTEDTRSVRWGDIDGDGDLDLAVGNHGEANQLYRNDGSNNMTLIWESADAKITQSIAWGDADGDGDLDLAVGNGDSGQEQVNQLFFNDGNGQLTLGWESSLFDVKHTRSVAWADGDRDGYLDLAIANINSVNQIYRNDGLGNLTLLWQSDSADVTSSVAWADGDNDGDMDVAFGNGDSFTGIEFVENVIQGEVGLPNNLPTLSILPPDNVARANYYAPATILTANTIPITYVVSDIDTEPIGKIELFYSTDGGGLWRPALATTNTITTNLSTGYQTQTTTPTAIIDNGTVSLTLQFTNSGTIEQLRLSLNISHAHNNQLSVGLWAPWPTPTGTHALLFDGVGDGGNGFKHLILDDTATTSIAARQGISTAVNGIYRPIQPLTRFSSFPLNIPYTLIVTDTGAGEVGTIESWSLTSVGAKHTFEWDTFASGFFGQSDNVTLWMIASGQGQEGSTQTHDYLNSVANSYQQSVVTAVTPPFRVRGTQVRVFSETVMISNTRANAVVYQLLAGQTAGADLMGGSEQPFRTNYDGYLQGRGALEIGDQLVALLPISTAISYTNRAIMYHTSAEPIEAGLAGNVVETPGIQILTTTANYPLILFDLDLSLEWDARNDGAFLANLTEGIENASEILYDLTNGQVALGEVRIHQAKANWVNSDIVIYANNSIRPTASIGGVITKSITDIISPTKMITDAYLPGQIHMGPIWDPFGENEADLTTYWWQALAHELAHYLLFLPDNYLGVVDGQIVPTDCQGSVMTNAYDSAYSEFLTTANWQGECLDTVAQLTTERNDWETIQKFYPMLSEANQLAGPAVLPLDVTQVRLIEPAYDAQTLPDQYFDLRYIDSGALAFRPQAQGYLFKTQNNDDLTDDTVILLGSATGSGDRLKVRGAEEGDRVCVFDQSDTVAYLGCIDNLLVATTTVALTAVNDWQPDLFIAPVSSRTLAITATLSTSVTQLNVQLLPTYGSIKNPNIITSAWAVMQPTNEQNLTFTKMLTVPYPAFEGVVRVWAPEATSLRETVSQFFLSAGWGPPTKVGLGHANARAWTANHRAAMAPVSSGEGQVTIYNVTDVFGDTGTASLQTLATVPDLPSWLTVVGQAYRFISTKEDTIERNITFSYLQRDVVQGYEREQNLAIYYYLPIEQVWQRLPTVVDVQFNLASTTMPLPSDGIYALMSTVAYEYPFYPEWNLFGWIIPGSRPVTEALASIAGSYTSVYGHFTTETPTWRLYDATVTEPFIGLVNNLTTLTAGKGYWLYATETVTLFAGLPDNNNVTQSNTPLTMFEAPPMTLYGWLTPTVDFTPTVGMTITAWVDGNLCGEWAVQSWHGGLAYTLQVRAETVLGMPNNCGQNGKFVSIQVGSWWMAHERVWNNRQAWQNDLTTVQGAPNTSPIGLSIMDESILLSWVPVTQTVKGQPTTIDHYEIWYGPTPYFTHETTETALLDSVSDTTYILPKNLGYYVVIAVDKNGLKSKFSNRVGVFPFNIE